MYVTDQIRLCRVQIRSAEIKSDQASRRHYLRIAIDVVVVIVIIIFNLRRAVILVYGPAIGLFDVPLVQTGVGNNGCAHDDADHYRHFTIGLIITVDGDDNDQHHLRRQVHLLRSRAVPEGILDVRDGAAHDPVLGGSSELLGPLFAACSMPPSSFTSSSGSRRHRCNRHRRGRRCNRRGRRYNRCHVVGIIVVTTVFLVVIAVAVVVAVVAATIAIAIAVVLLLAASVTRSGSDFGPHGAARPRPCHTRPRGPEPLLARYHRFRHCPHRRDPN